MKLATYFFFDKISYKCFVVSIIITIFVPSLSINQLYRLTIMKRLLNNTTDFENWEIEHNDCEFDSYSEDKPMYYPCMVVYCVEESYIYNSHTIKYEFVYQNDFE